MYAPVFPEYARLASPFANRPRSCDSQAGEDMWAASPSGGATRTRCQSPPPWCGQDGIAGAIEYPPALQNQIEHGTLLVCRAW